MEKKEEKKGKKGVVLLLILGLILVGGGVVLTYISSPKYVSQTVMKKFASKISETMNNQIQTGLEDNYKNISNIKIDLKSDYYDALATMNPSYAMTSNLLKKLSSTENTITTIQDKENKKLFLNFNSKLSGQELISTKYLVENATSYYSIDGITNTYVNNGTNNYFESLTSTTTSTDNNKYLIEKIGELLANNIEDSYLSSSYIEDYKVITMTLTEKNQVDYFNKVIDGLQQDEKANKIMTGYNANFSDIKLTEKSLTGLGTIKINIYLDKLLSQAVRYELELEENTKILYYQEDGKEIIEISSQEDKTVFEITTMKEKTEIVMKDANNTSLGTITISKTDTNYDIVATVKAENASFDFGYNYQITNLKKGKSYNSNTTITIKLTAQNTNILDGTITIASEVTNELAINEDTSTSVLASSLSGTQSELLQQKIALIILSLMS